MAESKCFTCGVTFVYDNTYRLECSICEVCYEQKCQNDMDDDILIDDEE